MVTNYFLFMVKWPLFKTRPVSSPTFFLLAMHLLPNQEDGLQAPPVSQKNILYTLYVIYTGPILIWCLTCI